ncbi:MAG TPA: flagellar M-ring protein FliF, partial [Acidimicrobiia bacterium]|nr:flagellar M-ring protein FliF [Acidimicrobiia bacterium]
MAALDMDRIRAQGKRFADGFTPGQKAMTLLGVVAVVIASMMFMRWAGSPTWGTLYTGLESADAAKVTDELTSQGVKFKLEDGGHTVLVP